MSLFDRFKSAISEGREREAFLLGCEADHSVFYVPFEAVNSQAELVLVGITPGPKQMMAAYTTARRLMQAHLADEEIQKLTKQKNAFLGMRDKINEMFDHFNIAQCIGLPAAETLWAENYKHFDATSIVPNAAFKGDVYFNGPFKTVLANSLLRSEFENQFIPSLEATSGRAKYIGMGPVVDAGLSWCADAGVIDSEQVLGYLPHASGASGSQFKYFMRRKRLEELSPKDPVRHRAAALDRTYTRLKENIEKWRQSRAAA